MKYIRCPYCKEKLHENYDDGIYCLRCGAKFELKEVGGGEKS